MKKRLLCFLMASLLLVGGRTMCAPTVWAADETHGPHGRSGAMLASVSPAGSVGSRQRGRSPVGTVLTRPRRQPRTPAHATQWRCSPPTNNELHAYIRITGYDPEVDYMALMDAAAEDGSVFALQMGGIYELQRNMKIYELGLDYPQTHYFELSTASEIREAMAADRRWYTEEDFDLLSRLVTQEVGASWVPDWVQQLTASVVINRVRSWKYPGTFREVIYQPGQYGPAWTGSIELPAFDRVKENCRKALDEWPMFPENVFGQSGDVSGEIYRTYYDPVGGAVYFCYG